MEHHTDDLPDGWHVRDDAVGEPTLWCGDVAVLRHCDINTGGELLGGERAEYRHLAWQVLTRVLAPDEATVERLAERLLAQGGHAEYASEKIRDLARDDVRIVLAALGAPEQTGPDGGQGEAMRAG